MLAPQGNLAHSTWRRVELFLLAGMMVGCVEVTAAPEGADPAYGDDKATEQTSKLGLDDAHVDATAQTRNLGSATEMTVDNDPSVQHILVKPVNLGTSCCTSA